MNESNVIKKIMDILCNSNRNPDYMSVIENKSYQSIKIFNILCMRLKVGPKTKHISIPTDIQHRLENTIDLAHYKKRDGWLLLPFLSLTDFEYYTPLILDIYDYCEFEYSGEIFGCCSKYIECSDNLGCVQFDKAWHRGCFYRQNLAKGKVFYGVNKNIF